MANTFDDGELYSVIRERLNLNADEVDALSTAVGSLQTQFQALQEAFDNISTGTGGAVTPTPAFILDDKGPTMFSGVVSNVLAGTAVTLTFSNGTATAATNAQGAWTVTTTARSGTYTARVTVGGVVYGSPVTTVATGTGSTTTLDPSLNAPTDIGLTKAGTTIQITLNTPAVTTDVTGYQLLRGTTVIRTFNAAENRYHADQNQPTSGIATYSARSLGPNSTHSNSTSKRINLATGETGTTGVNGATPGEP